MLRSPYIGYFFLNKVKTLPQLLGHSFRMNSKQHAFCTIAHHPTVMWHSHCLLLQTSSLFFRYIQGDTRNCTHAYKWWCLGGRVEKGAGGEHAHWSDAVHGRVVGSSLSSSHSDVSGSLCSSVLGSSSVSGSTSVGGSGHWRTSKAAKETPAVPEITFTKRCSRSFHTRIWEGNWSFNLLLYISTRFLLRSAMTCFARFLSSFNKARLSCKQMYACICVSYACMHVCMYVCMCVVCVSRVGRWPAGSGPPAGAQADGQLKADNH